MGGETLQMIAAEMLQSTNVFERDVSEIGYTNNQRKKIFLLDLVREETKKHDHRFRGKTEANLQRSYTAIAKSMVEYIEGYTAPFYFKQRTKKNFSLWLERIKDSYSVPGVSTPDELNVIAKDMDSGIAMLKLLHSRKGVTYEDLQTGLGIGERAVQKDLVKLSPSLYSGPQKPYVPFRIGDQPLQAEVAVIDNGGGAKEKRFYTPNTIHPLAMQMNVLQLATLLKALAHQYWEHEDEVSVLLGIDIWSQMSDYAKQKMMDYFAFHDQDLKEFIGILKDECPDDHACAFYTEKQMLKEIEMPLDQALEYLMKASGRIGTISLKSGQSIMVRQIDPMVQNDGKKAYEAMCVCGESIMFTMDQIKEIIFD